MDEFIRWPKPYVLLSTTRDEILSWMIENSDVKLLGKWQQLQHSKSMIPLKNLQGMTNNVGLLFSVGDTPPRSTISGEHDN